MKKDEIQAVDMVRRIRESHYQEIRTKSHEEIVAFFRKKAEAMTRKLDRAGRKKRSA